MKLINPKTRSLMNAFISHPSSSVLFIGSEAAGTIDVMQHVCSKLLPHELRHNIFTIQIEEPHKNINVEQIRELKKLLVTSLQQGQAVSRIVVIHAFHTATVEAQNALLKILEEPTEGTIIMLQAQSTDTLLQTVLSRVQHIPVLPLLKNQAQEFAAAHNKQQEFEKYFLLSQGEARLYESLILGLDTGLINSVEEAKAFLSLTVFKRLQQQKEYDKYESLIELIQNLERIAGAGLHSTNEKARQKWALILNELRTCKELLHKNVLVKLIFIRLCISL